MTVTVFEVIFQKRVRVFHRGFKTDEGTRPRVFVALSICRLRKFASVFEIVSNTGSKHGRVFNSFFIGFLNPST